LHWVDLVVRTRVGEKKGRLSLRLRVLVLLRDLCRLGLCKKSKSRYAYRWHLAFSWFPACLCCVSSRVVEGPAARSNPACCSTCFSEPEALLSWLQPKQDGGERHHRLVVGGALLVAGRHASELLQSVDEPLHYVALSVGTPVEPWPW
jgi:hypothetical protein